MTEKPESKKTNSGKKAKEVENKQVIDEVINEKTIEGSEEKNNIPNIEISEKKNNTLIDVNEEKDNIKNIKTNKKENKIKKEENSKEQEINSELSETSRKQAISKQEEIEKINEEESEELEENTTKKEKALTKKQIEEIKQVVKKELKANNKIPQEAEQSLFKKIFQNLGLAVMVVVYFNFIVLGFININNNVFLTDIKVFSMVMLIIAIIVFEIAYKKESGKYAIHGIEILILAFTTMALLYINLMWQEKFIPITVLITYIFSIYYIAKTIIIYYRVKKEYSASGIKEIIKK